MSEETKTELKLPKNYRRPSLAEFTGPGHRYPAERYEGFFQRHEEQLSEAMTSGELTDELFDEDLRKRGKLDDEGNLIEDEMADEDHDGLPDVLHVKSQVRAQANRTQRARHPTRHRFKQYLFSDPSKRLVRKRPLRIPAALVRANLDELIDKEAAGILSVHAPNGQRIDLAALKAGRVVMSALPATPPLANPPLDSVANDTPGGEHMQQYLGGTYVNDPAADEVVEEMLAEKAAEVAKKERGTNAEESGGEPGEEVDPAADPATPAAPEAPVVPTELEQPPIGVDGTATPIAAAPDTNTETSTETPTAPAFQGEAPEQQASAPVEAAEQDQSSMDPAEDAPKTSSSSKGGKKGHKR